MAYTYKYIIQDFTPTYTSTSQIKENQSIETVTNSNNGKTISLKRGTSTRSTGLGNSNYYGPVVTKKNIENQEITKLANQGIWGNRKQKEINFGNDAFSLGIKDTIPTYNLTKNKIQNFTLPNGQNLLSFLKKNNVQNGDNVEIKITKDRVELIKKKK